jgi:hypothetical protein
MRPLVPLVALLLTLLSVMGTACQSSPVTTDTVTVPPPATKPTAADSAALRKAAPAAATGQAVPFVGKAGLKAVLRSGGIAPAATGTR